MPLITPRDGSYVYPICRVVGVPILLMCGRPSVLSTGDDEAWSWLTQHPSGARQAAMLAISLFLAVRALVALTVSVAADARGRSALRLYTKWDAQWYAGIAKNGYGFVRQ